MQSTTHYALKKPDSNDTYNKANDNANMDAIDTQIYANAQAASTAQTTANNHIANTNNPHNVTAAQIGSPVLGTSNQMVNKFEALNQRVDTRSTTETYDGNGNLTQIVEKDGTTTVKTTTFTYTNGNITQVQEVVGGNTITTTLTYDGNNNLTGTSRTVA